MNERSGWPGLEAQPKPRSRAEARRGFPLVPGTLWVRPPGGTLKRELHRALDA
jgi:hypothetical protein